jgi:antitoxin component YwqK of YwqJK toxin-antitoxin module
MHLFAGKLARVSRRAFWLLLAWIVLGLQGCSKTIDAAEARVINGLVYKVHDKDPYSGTIRNIAIGEVMSIAGNGSCQRSYKAGRPDGVTTCMSDTGHKVLEQEWEGGRREGVERTWDPKTGNLHIDSHYRNGKRDGLYELYNPATGERIVRNEYRAGEVEGKQQIWDAATGETLLVDMEWHNSKQTGTSKLGSVEESYLNGKLHGLRRNLHH